MRIHWLQHVPFEGLGCIEPWLKENGHGVTCTRLWAGEGFPSIGRVDGLIVMGGPMGIYDDDQHPWLAVEKAFIKEIIDQNKPVLGICLGAQLVADALGAGVRPGREKEIGFYECRASVPLALTDRDGRSTLLGIFSEAFVAFHWHGDTFGIPDGAVHLASSEVTENQAFVYNGNVLALQFHLETTEESLLALYENCSDEIEEVLFFHSSEAREAGLPKAGRQRNEVKCQTLEEMQENFPMLGKTNALMVALLGRLFG